MLKTDRKELARAYKERPPSVGVFAVRCAATGQAWVGWSKSLDKRQNSLWFQLRTGGYPDRAMQAAWNDNGEEGFSFDTLEEITEDNPHTLATLLEERTAHWRSACSASTIAGR